jgi:hypothetical protein
VMNEARHIRVTDLQMVSEKCQSASTTRFRAGGALDRWDNNFLHCLPLSFVKRDNPQRVARADCAGRAATNELHDCVRFDRCSEVTAPEPTGRVDTERTIGSEG